MKTSKWRTPETVLIVVAFAMRIGFMLAGHTYRFSDVNNHFGFGFETGSIAGAIARGEGFSSPFGVPTGPTAWIGPVYPYLLAGIFKIFGLFSDASAIAILTINSAFAALTCWTIFEIAENLFGRRAAIVSATMWAVVPFFFRYAITWVWDPPISAFVLSLGVLLAIRMEAPTLKQWVWFGVLAGISSLLNPALSSLFPLLMFWIVWRQGSMWRGTFAPAVLSLLIMGACMAPWLIRNRLVFGEWVFLRSNAPFEFSVGNFPGSPGGPYAGRAPVNNRRLMDEYRRMGEIAFVKARGAESMAWAKSHPNDFIRLTLTRMAAFWDGSELRYEPVDDPWRPWMVALESALALCGLAVAWRRRVPKLGPFVLILLFYPLPYYIVYTNPRYRHAIVPLLVILIGYFLVSLWDRLRSAKNPEPHKAFR